MERRIWKDKNGNKAVIVLFSEMADWQTQFSQANSLWHKEEEGKGRSWISKRKRKGLTALLSVGIAKLTEKQKSCFYLYHYKGKKEKDIAVILGVSQQTVSRTKDMALKKLRKILGVNGV